MKFLCITTNYVLVVKVIKSYPHWLLKPSLNLCVVSVKWMHQFFHHNWQILSRDTHMLPEVTITTAGKRVVMFTNLRTELFCHLPLRANWRLNFVCEVTLACNVREFVDWYREYNVFICSISDGLQKTLRL